MMCNPDGTFAFCDGWFCGAGGFSGNAGGGGGSSGTSAGGLTAGSTGAAGGGGTNGGTGGVNGSLGGSCSTGAAGPGASGGAGSSGSSGTSAGSGGATSAGGGGTSGGGGGTGTSGGSGSAGAGGPCPVSEPAVGAACFANAGPGCQYGAESIVACRPTYWCDGAVWQTKPFYPAGCPAHGTIGDGACPATTPVNGMPCVDPGFSDPGIVCDAGAGAVCACSAGCSPKWACVPTFQDPPGSGCPPLAPNVGAACGAGSPECLYLVGSDGYALWFLCSPNGWVTDGLP